MRKRRNVYFAERTLKVYRKATGAKGLSLASLVSDLLADLHHFAVWSDLSWGDLLSRAELYYTAEVGEDDDDFVEDDDGE